MTDKAITTEQEGAAEKRRAKREDESQSADLRALLGDAAGRRVLRRLLFSLNAGPFPDSMAEYSSDGTLTALATFYNLGRFEAGQKAAQDLFEQDPPGYVLLMKEWLDSMAKAELENRSGAVDEGDA